MKLTSNLLRLGVLAACLVAAVGCTPKYAVLLSTNKVLDDDIRYHSEWWYDLVQQYQMLRDSGFRDDRIYVLYGDGTDFPTAHLAYDSTARFGRDITDRPMNKGEVEKIFQSLDRVMRRHPRRGYLYVWWMGHGFGAGPDSCDLTMSISHTDEEVTDAELKAYIDQVRRYRKRSISIMTCHAGGLVNNFSNPVERNVVLASSTCAESSYDAPATCDGIFHAEFNDTQPRALRQVNFCAAPVASDADGNGWVSLGETHTYNAAVMVTSTPQLGDASALAPVTWPARPKP
jgi:hypothetical protein